MCPRPHHYRKLKDYTLSEIEDVKALIISGMRTADIERRVPILGYGIRRIAVKEGLHFELSENNIRYQRNRPKNLWSKDREIHRNFDKDGYVEHFFDEHEKPDPDPKYLEKYPHPGRPVGIKDGYGRRATMRVIECLTCGKEFIATWRTTDKIEGTKIKRKYCSRECYLKAQYIRKPLLKISCLWCGNPFTTRKSKQKFCSKQCRIDYHNTMKAIK